MIVLMTTKILKMIKYKGEEMKKEPGFGDTVYVRYGSVNYKSLHHPYYFNEKLHYNYWEYNRWQEGDDADPKFSPRTILAIASNGTWLLSDGNQTDIDIFRGELRRVVSVKWPDEEYKVNGLIPHLQTVVLTEEEMNEEIENRDSWYSWNEGETNVDETGFYDEHYNS